LLAYINESSTSSSITSATTTTALLPINYTKWSCKRHILQSKKKKSKQLYLQKPKTPLTKEKIIRILQTFGRCILARHRILEQANSIYRRVWDSESESFYYANIDTGETSWTKNTIFLTTEPLVYSVEEASQNVTAIVADEFSDFYLSNQRSISSKKLNDLIRQGSNSSNLGSMKGGNSSSFSTIMSNNGLTRTEKRFSPRINRLNSFSSKKKSIPSGDTTVGGIISGGSKKYQSGTTIQ
jgi:glycogen debranching enzyme